MRRLTVTPDHDHTYEKNDFVPFQHGLSRDAKAIQVLCALWGLVVDGFIRYDYPLTG
jgi:hypothetical protein